VHKVVGNLYIFHRSFHRIPVQQVATDHFCSGACAAAQKFRAAGNTPNSVIVRFEEPQKPPPDIAGRACQQNPGFHRSSIIVRFPGIIPVKRPAQPTKILNLCPGTDQNTFLPIPMYALFFGPANPDV
jgi:hypothetical protein